MLVNPSRSLGIGPQAYLFCLVYNGSGNTLNSRPHHPFSKCQSSYAIASYPGSSREGKKRAWYLLFAHALNYLTFQSFGFLRVRPCYADVTSQLATLWTLR